MTKTLNIFLLLLIFQLNFGQEDCKSEIYSIKFNVIEKTTQHNIGGPFIEILTGNERIGFDQNASIINNSKSLTDIT